MFADLEIFRMSAAMAVHAGKSQAVIARNVANADTPGYKAMSVSSFRDSYQADETTAGMRASRSAHLHGYSANNLAMRVDTSSGEGAPNGNTVSLESELLSAANTKSQHDRALAIYKSALSILRLTVSK